MPRWPFYQAFEAKDVDAMMTTWAEDEEIVCVHPAAPGSSATTPCAWAGNSFSRAMRGSPFRLDQVVMIETVGLAMQSAVEHVALGSDGTPRGAGDLHQRVSCAPRRAGGWSCTMRRRPPIAADAPAGPLH
jgi:ketosteroid isomerase-like protein